MMMGDEKVDGPQHPSCGDRAPLRRLPGDPRAMASAVPEGRQGDVTPMPSPGRTRTRSDVHRLHVCGPGRTFGLVDFRSRHAKGASLPARGHRGSHR
jgi:hypothetical protein